MKTQGYDFEFERVFVHPKCFPLFLFFAESESNQDIVTAFLKINVILALIVTTTETNRLSTRAELDDSKSVENSDLSMARAYNNLNTAFSNHIMYKIVQREENRVYGEAIERINWLLQHHERESTEEGHSSTCRIAPNDSSSHTIDNKLKRNRQTSQDGTNFRLIRSQTWYTPILGSIIDQYAKCSALIRLFFTNHTRHQLTISHSTCTGMNELYTQLDDYFSHVLPHLLWETDEQELQQCLDVINTYAENIFVPCKSVLTIVMRDNIFARFKRSQMWIQHVESCSIGVLKEFGEEKSKYTLEPLLVTPEDLERKAITNRDVSLNKMLLRDDYHWEPIQQRKNNMSIYFSRFNTMSDDCVSEHGYFHAFKITYPLKMNAKLLTQQFISKKLMTKLSTEKIESIDYLPGSGDKDINDPEFQYPTSVVYQGPLGSALLKREYIKSCTAFYDKDLKSYLYIYKSCESDEYKHHLQNYVRALSFGVACFTDIGDDQCYYTSVFLVNSGGILRNRRTYPALFERWTITRFLKRLISRMDRLDPNEREIDDDLRLMQTLNEHSALVGDNPNNQQ